MLNGNTVSQLPDAAYEEFKSEFEKLTGIQLNLYKEKQMKRRIGTLIERKGLSDYREFLALLKAKPSELAAFVDYITINVTEFFRTSDHWKCFEETILTELLSRKNGPLRIWSCACSTGEEAYSLAMSILNISSDAAFEIIATDIDETVLEKARMGFYDEKNMETFPDEMKKYIVSNGMKRGICDEVRKHISFGKLDLLRDTYPGDCDLIVCRNVLIYFTEEGKTKVYEGFLKSMKSGAYLFTGNTEQIIYHKVYGLKKIKNYIYGKE